MGLPALRVVVDSVGLAGEHSQLALSHVRAGPSMMEEKLVVLVQPPPEPSFDAVGTLDRFHRIIRFVDYLPL
ncbi:hypothetical protein [Saccharopolyspora shandongensis]|uniref:hypothetical protein n=1 Tax=Saccharopolyspora shandongensis TaxID=418495 RepID=UPI0033F2E068